jgi:hypothetical protein
LFQQRWTPPLFHLPLGPYPRSFIKNSELLRWATAWIEAARMVSSSSHYPAIVYCLSWRNENEPSSRDKLASVPWHGLTNTYKEENCYQMGWESDTQNWTLDACYQSLENWERVWHTWHRYYGTGIGCCCNSHYQPSVFPGGPAQCTTSRNLRELLLNKVRELPPFIHEMAMSPPHSTITSFSLLTFKNCVVFSSFCNNCHSPDINYISSVAGFIHSKKITTSITSK